MSQTDIQVLHRIIRFLAGLAVSSFFTEVHVIGGENVPKEGPIIVTATHHNMMLDPVILSVAFPHRRRLNYWSKASLFANPIMRYILLSSGNIPVDRKSKDRQILYKGTIDALSDGQAVALFPEGTSYTEPRIMQVKDGAAGAALEFAKSCVNNPNAPKQGALIIPASIVYTNKSKYRSSVIMEFGRPIPVEEYKDQYISSKEGDSRAAVKKLTRAIEAELVEATINAPDWDTLYAARMARDLLWEKHRSVDLDDFVAISQTLVDLFSTTDAVPNMKSIKQNLLEYYSLLDTTHMTNSVLSSLPLPRSLDPNTPATFPSRLYTLLILIRDSLAALARFPFFLFPFIIHLPVYFMGRLGASLVKDEEETQAQNKLAFGLLSLLLVYPAAFVFLWALLRYTPVGAILAAITVYLLARYHIMMIDDNYEGMKRFVAAWRLLVGVWVPKKWDMSLSALSQYTTPRTPPENPWIDRPKTPVSAPGSPVRSPPVNDNQFARVEPPVKARPKRRPPTRRLMRHVLRARVEAVKALAGFFDQLANAGSSKLVKASPHLARQYGEVVKGETLTPEGTTVETLEGYRRADEIITYLRKRGAKIPSRASASAVTHEGDWAALSSDGESSTPAEEKEGLEWVPPAHGQ